MYGAPIFSVRKRIVTIVLTDCHASRHTVAMLQQSTKIIGEGAWLRNSH